MTDVSVITLNYKEPLYTKTCVEKLLRQKDVLVEIIIIDNSATVDDKKILSTIHNKRVRVIHMGKNIGCASGYNYGINLAKGKYVFILNNDTVIQDLKAIVKMKKFLDTHSKIAVLQPKIKSLKNPQYYEYAGAAGGFLDIFGYPFCRGRIFQTVEKDNHQYDTVSSIAWASTCAFFAKKKILYEVGLFDPIYFAYAEEVDISLCIWNRGYEVVYFPFTEVLHRGESSWKKIRGRKTFYIHRNHLILYLKCTPFPQVLYKLPQRLLLEILSLMYYPLTKSSLHMFPVIFSYLVVVFLLPKILYKRRVFFANKKISNALIYTKSIALEHFFRRKNNFTELDSNKYVVYG